VTRFTTVVTIQPASPTGTGQDRADVFQRSDGGITVVLADGAGGTANGTHAAETLIAAVAVTTNYDHPASTNPWPALLSSLDDPSRMRGGQTTAVVLTLTRDRILGASVGDSGAWLVSPPDTLVDLTDGQRRKPLLGAGSGLPPLSIDHGALPADATLLVASDGLLAYATRSAIARAALSRHAPAPALLDLVRLPTGAFQDDVSIVLVSTLTLTGK
jgi:serine/threonine protein phosphatase PrpC